MSDPGCAVTVWDRIPPTYNGGRGERVTKERRCGEPVVADGLCEHHRREKERLA